MKKLVGTKCPKCGRDLVYRKNKIGESFIGCEGYPKCKHTEDPYYEYMSDVEKCVLKFPNMWRPNCSRDVYALLQNKCGSIAEAEYLFGAAYYIDENKKPDNRIPLSVCEIKYEGSILEGVQFYRPYSYLEICYCPSSFAFVPQSPFMNGEYVNHHDFGFFISDQKEPTENDWAFKLALEIDIAATHYFRAWIDEKRDSVVNYPVIRIKPKPGERMLYLSWFSQIIRIFDNECD